MMRTIECFEMRSNKRANQTAKMRNYIISLDKGNIFYVNISEQFTIRECVRPFEESNLDL